MNCTGFVVTKMQLPLVLVSLTTLLVSAQDSGHAGNECVNKLENCSALVHEGNCNSGSADHVKLGCARSCGLCGMVNGVEAFFRAQRRQPNTKRKPNPDPKRNVSRPRQQVNHRPNIRQPPHSNVRHVSHSKPRATKSRPRHQVPHRPVNKRRPRSQIKNRQARRQNRPKNSPPKKPQQVREPKFGAGTVPDSNQNPIGPNEIKVPAEAIAISKMAQTSKEAQEVTAKFEEINKNTEKIVQKMDEMSNLMEDDGKVSNHLEISNFGDVITNQHDFVRMSSKAVFPGKLIKAASVAVEYVETVKEDISYGVQKIKQVYSAITSFSPFGGSKHIYIVSKVQKTLLRAENNFWRSLDSFVVDFGKSVKDVAQIQANFNSTSTGFVVVANVIKKANGVVDDIKSIRQKITDAKNQFNKIREDVKSAGQSFKQITNDFKSMVETVSKGNGNLPVDRKPLTSTVTKKPDPPAPKKPDPTTTTKKPADASKVISIRCNTNKFVWSDAADGNAMKCFKDTPGHFKMIPVNEKVSLQSESTSKYCSSEDSKEAMHCNRDVVQDWELFEKIDNSDGTVSFKCSNNKYMSSQNGLKLMDCTGDKINEWEKFRIE